LRPNRFARLLLFLAILLVIVVPLLSGGLDLIVDYIWFRQEGFGLIYWTLLKARIDLGTLAALFVLLAVGGNVMIARLLARRHGYRIYGELIEFPLFERFANLFERLIGLAVVLVAWAAGEWASGYGFNYLSALHSVPLGQSDPVFGIDLSFYLFKLPFIGFLYDLVLVAIIVFLQWKPGGLVASRSRALD